MEMTPCSPRLRLRQRRHKCYPKSQSLRQAGVETKSPHCGEHSLKCVPRNKELGGSLVLNQLETSNYRTGVEGEFATSCTCCRADRSWASLALASRPALFLLQEASAALRSSFLLDAPCVGRLYPCSGRRRDLVCGCAEPSLQMLDNRSSF